MTDNNLKFKIDKYIRIFSRAIRLGTIKESEDYYELAKYIVDYNNKKHLLNCYFSITIYPMLEPLKSGEELENESLNYLLDPELESYKESFVRAAERCKYAILDCGSLGDIYEAPSGGSLYYDYEGTEFYLDCFFASFDKRYEKDKTMRWI